MILTEQPAWEILWYATLYATPHFLALLAYNEYDSHELI